ncbi:MAG: hypothetical protein HZB99_01675 [Candidatus Harrisonbacteria bacterium]|nr:hypothetical protein [Candidatus Harrisonbacteria bacterium]
MQSYLDQHQINKQGRNFRIKIYFGFLILILILILIIYTLVYSPIFKIKEFRVAGVSGYRIDEILRMIEPQILTTRVKNFLGDKNLLVWDVNNPDLSKTALAEAVIKRDWLRQSIIIDAQERERLAIWCDKNNNCYWLDKQGILFENAPQTEGSLILTVQDISPATAIKNTKIIEERFAPNLIAVVDGLKRIRMPIKEIIFKRELQEIHVKTYSGPDLLFSIRFDPTLNLESLQSLMEKTGLKNVQYIDLRVENRIFYKNL